MTGVLPFGFYQGSRSEYLAIYVLSRICAVTPVPRQTDFGVDMICNLAKREGGVLKVGAPFAVQVKSDPEPVGYPGEPASEGNAAVRWLLDQTIPFTLAIAERSEQRVRLYSTWPLVKLRYERGFAFRQILLIPGNDGDEVEEPLWSEHTGRGEVFLGPPILDFTPLDVEDSSRADHLSEVLSAWIYLELENYANKVADVCYVQGYIRYKPNEKPTGKRHLWIAFGKASLPGFRRRLAEVLTVAGHALEEVEGIGGAIALKAAMELCEDELDPLGSALLGRLRG